MIRRRKKQAWIFNVAVSWWKDFKDQRDNRADAEMSLFVMQLKATQLQAVTPSPHELWKVWRTSSHRPPPPKSSHSLRWWPTVQVPLVWFCILDSVLAWRCGPVYVSTEETGEEEDQHTIPYCRSLVTTAKDDQYVHMSYCWTSSPTTWPPTIYINRLVRRRLGVDRWCNKLQEFLTGDWNWTHNHHMMMRHSVI